MEKAKTRSPIPLIILIVFTLAFAAGLSIFAYLYAKESSDKQVLENQYEDLQGQNTALSKEIDELEDKSKKVKAYCDWIDYFLVLSTTIEGDPTEEQIAEVQKLTNATGDEDLTNLVNTCIEQDSISESNFYLMLDIVLDGIAENSG